MTLNVDLEALTVRDSQTDKKVSAKNLVESTSGIALGTALTGVAHSVVVADVGTTISSASASAVTITVNQGAFTEGEVVSVIQDGAGLVSFAAGGGVTLNGTLSLNGQYSMGAIVYRGSDTWTVFV